MTVHRLTAELGDLARHLRGRLIVPGDRDWDAARQPWNRRIDQRPAAVVAPQGPDDIAATVSFAARCGLQVTAQSSGHGAGDRLENTVLLRTDGLREIILDPAQERVRVGAGVLSADLAAAISPHGLAASLGWAPDAGVVGYAMFGGVGVLGRALGFMAHQMLAADVITADGSLMRCDATTHPDLMWALRGAGGGFALVTRLDLRLARMPALFGGQIVWPVEAAPEVLPAWRSWTASMPPEMTSSASVLRLPPLPEVPEPLRGRGVTAVTACYAGPAEAGASLMRQLTSPAVPLFNACRPLAPADLATLYGTPATPIPARIQAELLNDLPGAALDEFIRHAGPDSGSPLLVAEIRHLGGAYAQEPPDASGAIGRTGAHYLIELVGLAATGEADAEIWDRQQAVAAALSPWTTGMILPSFAGPGTDAGRVFPPATRQRLTSIKQRYDPGNILRTSFPR